MRPIDADALKLKVIYMYGVADVKFVPLKDIEKAPTIEAEPVLHGRWVLEREPGGTPYCFHCSVCDDDFRRIEITTAYPSCPNC